MAPKATTASAGSRGSKAAPARTAKGPVGAKAAAAAGPRSDSASIPASSSSTPPEAAAAPPAPHAEVGQFFSPKAAAVLGGLGGSSENEGQDEIKEDVDNQAVNSVAGSLPDATPADVDSKEDVAAADKEVLQGALAVKGADEAPPGAEAPPQPPLDVNVELAPDAAGPVGEIGENVEEEDTMPLSVAVPPKAKKGPPPIIAVVPRVSCDEEVDRDDCIFVNSKLASEKGCKAIYRCRLCHNMINAFSKMTKKDTEVHQKSAWRAAPLRL